MVGFLHRPLLLAQVVTEEGVMKCAYCPTQDEELHWPTNTETGKREPVCAACLITAPPGKFDVAVSHAA